MRVSVPATVLLFAAMPAMAGTFTPYFGQTLNPTSNPANLGATSAVRVAQNNFLQRLSGNSVESFEGFADQNVPATGLGLTFSGSAGSLGATLTRSGAGTLQVRSTNLSGAYATNGSKYIFTDSTTSGGFRVDLSQPTAAFGFVATDVGDFGVSIDLELTSGQTVTVDIPHLVGSGGNINGNAFFFGVVAEDFTFNRIDFTITSGGTFDSFGFDEMTIGDPEQVVPIPLPQASGLAIASFGLLAVRRRRSAE